MLMRYIAKVEQVWQVEQVDWLALEVVLVAVQAPELQRAYWPVSHAVAMDQVFVLVLEKVVGAVDLVVDNAIVAEL